MRSATLITGFCAGKGNTERLAEALERDGPYDQVNAFTFREAQKKLGEVRRAMCGSPVITHSMGALVIDRRHATPSELHLLGAPLPSSPRALLARGAVVGARMHLPEGGVHSRDDLMDVLRFDRSYLGEAMLHGATYLRKLGAIAAFDAVKMAVESQDNGIPTSLMYADHDAFFQMTPDREDEARAGGARVTHLPGEHNDPLVWPLSFVPRYFAQLEAAA